jgi:hypothetical protein
LKLIHISNYKHDCKDNIVAIFTTIITCYFVGGDTEMASGLSRPTKSANRSTNSALRAIRSSHDFTNFTEANASLKFGGDTEIRTPDLLLAKQAL